MTDTPSEAGLVELEYRLTGPSTMGDGAYHLRFLCPKCRKHEIMVAIWSKDAGERYTGHVVCGEDLKERVWHYEGGPWPDIWAKVSITPSIDCTPQGFACGGWHGFVTNGVCVP